MENLLVHYYVLLSNDSQINFIHDIIKQSPSKISYGSYVYLDKRLLLGVRKTTVLWILVQKIRCSFLTHFLDLKLADWEPGGDVPHSYDAVHMSPSAYLKCDYLVRDEVLIVCQSIAMIAGRSAPALETN